MTSTSRCCNRVVAFAALAALSPLGFAPVPAVANGMDRCHTAGLTLALGQPEGAAGHLFQQMLFTNTLDVWCWMYGYVGAQLLDDNGNPMATMVVRGGGMYPDPGPTVVTVAPGGQAAFELEWEHIPVGDERTCPTSTSIAVIPPDEYDALTVPAQVDACGGGQLHVSAVALPSIGPD